MTQGLNVSEFTHWIPHRGLFDLNATVQNIMLNSPRHINKTCWIFANKQNFYLHKIFRRLAEEELLLKLFFQIGLFGVSVHSHVGRIRTPHVFPNIRTCRYVTSTLTVQGTLGVRRSWGPSSFLCFIVFTLLELYSFQQLLSLILVISLVRFQFLKL